MPTGRTASDVLPGLDLVRFRQSAGVSLEEIMERTKLSRRFLEAIETARYRELPGGVFDINYLRQYAAATGYDVSRLLEHYKRSTGVWNAGEPEGGRWWERVWSLVAD